MLDPTEDDRFRAVVNALCGPLGTPLADAYLNDSGFKAGVERRVADLMLLVDHALARSIVRRERLAEAVAAAEAAPTSFTLDAEALQ